MSVAPSDASVGLADLTQRRSPADRLFRVVLVACASSVLVIIIGIVAFLARQAGPAWRHQGLRLFTTYTYNPSGFAFGFEGALTGSLIIAVIALMFAAPVSVAAALAVNEYVPRRARPPLIALIDLLAALPSLIYGMWGKLFLDRHVYRTSVWLGHHAAFFPPFRLEGSQQVGLSLFLAGMVVAIMVMPLMTAVTREVMSQVPREDCEAALALGGTRWGMITEVVLPFSRNGIVGGGMLALGRALGETIAVSLVLSSDNRLTSHILQPGGGSVSALIVTHFQSGGPLERSALTVAGLTLFAVTLSINIGARFVVGRTGARR